MNINIHHKAWHIITYLFAGILILGICSCEEYARRKKVNYIVKEWTGKTIVFDPEIPCMSIMQDTIYPSPNNKPYKILLYVDAKGCASCKIQTEKWKSIIEEADSTLSGLLDFEFYFYPKKNAGNILHVMRINKFSYPVHIDRKDRLNTLNKFPTDPKYQCFLLDKDNKVLLIGNPFTNPGIWELYKKTILNDPQTLVPFFVPLWDTAHENGIHNQHVKKVPARHPSQARGERNNSAFFSINREDVPKASFHAICHLQLACNQMSFFYKQRQNDLFGRPRGRECDYSDIFCAIIRCSACGDEGETSVNNNRNKNFFEQNFTSSKRNNTFA
jgi:hypothetical protein